MHAPEHTKVLVDVLESHAELLGLCKIAHEIIEAEKGSCKRYEVVADMLKSAIAKAEMV